MKTDHPIILEMLKATQEDNEDLIAEMPDKAETDGQRALQFKHGTPRQFARACVNAIGDISILQAHAAIVNYEREWRLA